MSDLTPDQLAELLDEEWGTYHGDMVRALRARIEELEGALKALLAEEHGSMKRARAALAGGEP